MSNITQNPNFLIRQELPKDYKTVFYLVTDAFRDMHKSNHKEQYLVNNLRESNAFIPELSLVALMEDKLVGHILLTRVVIKNNKQQEFPSLTLAPVSVLPSFQKKGIGSALIKTAHKIALGMGFGSVTLLGHASYYPRFGYKPCAEFDIALPFNSPPENCMIIELFDNSLAEVSGMVEYPAPFFD